MKKVDLLGLTLFTLMTMSTLGGILSGCQDRTNEPQQKGVVKTNTQNTTQMMELLLWKNLANLDTKSI